MKKCSLKSWPYRKYIRQRVREKNREINREYFSRTRIAVCEELKKKRREVNRKHRL